MKSDHSLSPTKFRHDQQQENTIVNRQLLWDIKKEPCVDCGLRWNPYVMTFDHRNRTGMKLTPSGRPVNINACTYWNPIVFKRQLELMDLVCKNCHFLREAVRDLNNPMVSVKRIPDIQEGMAKSIGGALIEVPLNRKGRAEWEA